MHLLNGHYTIPIYTLILLPSDSNHTFWSSVALGDAVRHWDNWIWGASAISRVLQNDWHMISWQRTNRTGGGSQLHTLQKWCQNGSNFAWRVQFLQDLKEEERISSWILKDKNHLPHTFKRPKSSQSFRRFMVYLKTRVAWKLELSSYIKGPPAPARMRWFVLQH